MSIEFNLYRSGNSLQGASPAGSVPTGLFTPLFEDDFSSGDISNHNDFFRWGEDGTIPDSGEASGSIDSVIGPDGVTTVNAFRFQYGTWQEIRFHLTESVSQMVSAADNPTTDSHYPEVWLSYDMFVPANYHHDDATPPLNNKYLALWQGEYSTNAKLQGVIEVWPTPLGSSELAINIDGHIRNFDFVDSAYQSTANNPDGALAFLPSQHGEWVNITMRWVAPTTHGASDGIYEYYIDGELKARKAGVNYQKRNPQVSGPIGFNKGYLLGYHNTGYAQTTTFYITNVKFGGTSV